MQKETNEFYGLFGNLLNTGYHVMEDGSFQFENDLTKMIPLLLEIQPGIGGIGKYGDEAAKSTIADKETHRATFESKLSNVGDDDAYDLTQGFHGINCLLSLAYRKGRKEGEEALIARLKSGEVQLADL